jgi:hypothetical protein
MRARTILAASCLVFTSAVLAADSPSIRPGRWEFTVQLDFGQRKVPEGMPFAEPMVDTSCVLPEASDLMALSSAALEGEGCKVSDYKSTAKEVSYNAVCEEVTMSLKWVLNSPDSVSGYSTSSGEDPSEKLTMKFAGKRIGDQCTAQETADAREELKELKAMLAKK